VCLVPETALAEEEASWLTKTRTLLYKSSSVLGFGFTFAKNGASKGKGALSFTN